MNKISLFGVIAILFLNACCSDPMEVSSPDGNIKVCLSVEDGALNWSSSAFGETVFEPSTLCLHDAGKLLEGPWRFAHSRVFRHKERWSQPWGENKEILSHYRELSAAFVNEAGTSLNIRVRAFDDGFGFRYEIDSPADSLKILNEGTEFRFADDVRTWSIPANFETYELKYRDLPLSKLADAQTPMTFKTASGTYGSIHEAALYDYPEMVLSNAGELSMTSDLAPLPGTDARAVVGGKFKTPWRSVQLARSATGLINSSLILNLNEPCAIADVSWIRPQKYVGVWWGMHLGVNLWYDSGKKSEPTHGATTESAIRHIDFAAENNIDGVLFEGWNKGWDTWGGTQTFDYVKGADDFDVEKVRDYAAEKGVSLWMHNETGGNVPDYEANLEKAFSNYESNGIHVVKTGYAGGFKHGYLHHSQYGVKHYQKVVEKAAEHEICLDVHEPIKATGIRRTFPNMMTREGARGMEWNAWSEGNDAGYLCTLPYVRLLGGPMDYTPGVFDLDYSYARENLSPMKMWNGDNRSCCIKTTLARQIANWVIIYSPLQMACDLIENYEGHPAFQFFRDFDADCSWSKALKGEIGEYIAIARKSASSDTWFIGAGANASERTLEIPLDFLPRGRYVATIYSDDFSEANPAELFSATVAPIYGNLFGKVNPESCTISTHEVSRTDTLSLKMLPSGGAAVTIQKLYER